MTNLVALGLFLALTSLTQDGSRREPVAPAPAPRPSAVLAAPHPEWQISGVVLDEWGGPLAGWTVGAQDTASSLLRWTWGETAKVTTDARGRFLFQSNLGTSLALILRSPDESIVALREDFTLDGHALELRLRPEDRPSAFLEGLLLGPGGEELPGAGVELWSEDAPVSAKAEIRGQGFRIGPLPPGGYTLSAFAEGWPRLATRVEVGAHETLDLGLLRLAAPGWIRVHVVHPALELGELDLVATELFRDGRHRSGSVRNGPMAETYHASCGMSAQEPLPPRGLSAPLAPGRYLLRTRAPRWCAPDAWVEVRTGETAELELALVPATARTLVLGLPERDPAIRLRLCVTTTDGKLRWEEQNGYRGRNGFTLDLDGLLPGSYRFEARTPAGSELLGTFVVDDLCPASGPLLDELR